MTATATPVPLLEFAGDKTGHLTPKEAANYIPYSEKTIRDMCASQQLKPVLELGGLKQKRYKIPRSTIRAFLTSKTPR
ncbi:hypothetical protein GCM10009785_01230 [Brooklawnia cerclae]|uniref:Helix-turn-helix domain-containing protein n=1 Tax=Brooklawnia cerclae TaxID=349934 RepID=A0ABX0SD05_9ACTN|nr:helix-turn-helix domain-containing protein [Brooklawnia cerclae]NIH56284.1 hypothetical protein [Brooklawnia cerclae]